LQRANKLRVILNLFTFIPSRYSSVGVVTCLWRRQLRDLEHVLGTGKRFMYTSKRPGRPWDQLADFCSMGLAWFLLLLEQWPGREAVDWIPLRGEMEL